MKDCALFGKFDYEKKLQQLVVSLGSNSASKDALQLLDELNENTPDGLDPVHVAAVFLIICEGRGVISHQLP